MWLSSTKSKRGFVRGKDMQELVKNVLRLATTTWKEGVLGVLAHSSSVVTQSPRAEAQLPTVGITTVGTTTLGITTLAIIIMDTITTGITSLRARNKKPRLCL